MLGLIANNFVRIYHPFTTDRSTTAKTEANYECSGQQRATRSERQIDAAILAIDHSFIVDHYDCGAKLGTLTVNGAIAQKYRGAVGTTGSGSRLHQELQLRRPPPLPSSRRASSSRKNRTG